MLVRALTFTCAMMSLRQTDKHDDDEEDQNDEDEDDNEDDGDGDDYHCIFLSYHYIMFRTSSGPLRIIDWITQVGNIIFRNQRRYYES